MNVFIIQLLSVLKSVVEVVILLMIHMPKYIFQINVNVKVFTLISRVNETRQESNECESRLMELYVI